MPAIAAATRPTPARVVGSLRQLSPAPRVLPRVQKLLGDPDSGLFALVELIRLDAGLTARVVQVSNSTWFGRGAICRTIEEAINRVGFREVHRLVATAAASTVVAQPLQLYSLDALTSWRESVACALAAELIAARAGEDMAAAYTLGLLHAIGRMAISHYALTMGGADRLDDAGFPVEHSTAETVWLGFTQADVGACMLHQWEFSAEMIEPIRAQYAPLRVSSAYGRMAAVLHGARFLRTLACRPDLENAARADGAVLSRLQLSETEILELMPDLRQQLLKARQLTDLSSTHS